VLEAAIVPRGPYRLRLMARSGHWTGSLPSGRRAEAWQRPDGRVVVRASDEGSLELARFMLALDDDTGPFHRRYANDPLLGRASRALVGFRPLRLATVAHATLRAISGQLIEARRARTIERAIARAVGEEVVTQTALASLAPAELRRLGLAQHRATALARLVRTIDLETLRRHPTDAVLARLTRERGVGPWSVGVIALEGLGRYDHGLVGDLGLVKLHSALEGRWVETRETASLLAPYGEWQGLAGEMLMRGAALGLVAGASLDAARIARRKARAA
jgi:AraC family transcriptional regulator of adaptative response / DNA-3-methyladenine glycosylase II